MARPISPKELDAIESAVAQMTQGGSLEEISAALEEALGRRLPRRTLQRRLSLLVEQGKLVLEGAGRGARYRVTAPRVNVQEGPGGVVHEGEIPLSPAAQKIRAAVRGSIQQRKPVGYNRQFLDAYRPNETAYLPTSLRQQLMDAGHTPAGDLPARTYVRQIYNRLLIDLSWNSSRHEGNFARYRIRPSEFEVWRRGWR